MTQDNRETPGVPDPHALKVAEAAQALVEPDIVILFGSRAVGDHRDDSDIDILVVTEREHHISARLAVQKAAETYMRENPPGLELGIISMGRKIFDRCRLANQHVAGQAVLYGVIISGERLDYRYDHDDDYPDHWPETRQRIRNAEEWQHTLDQMDDENHWNKKLIGLSAEQALENALKGWLSTHQDTGRYGHNLGAAWRKIDTLEDWSAPGMEQVREAVQDLFDRTTYLDPSPEDPDKTGNWLTLYAAVYRYGDSSHTMTREEQKELREKVDQALDSVVRLIHDRSGTTDDDAYPEGMKPWEL